MNEFLSLVFRHKLFPFQRGNTCHPTPCLWRYSGINFLGVGSLLEEPRGRAVIRKGLGGRESSSGRGILRSEEEAKRWVAACGGSLVGKSCLTLKTPWTVAFQVPVSMGFSRQEY